jgi:HK97 family phage portal protein
MNITLGKINISISKNQQQEKASAIEVASGQQLSPWLFNRYDNPRQNIFFIRETVSACMHARSEAIGRGKFHGYELARSKGLPVKRQLAHDHPLEALLRNPNPLFDLSDILELSSQWLDATGNTILLKVRNGFGTVTELWPLPALSFLIEKGADEMPVYYTFFPTNAKIPAEDIIHIKRSDIRTAPFYGHAILSDILDTAKTDAALRFYQQRFFDNDSVPRAVLKFPKGTVLTQDQMDEIRHTWEEKYQGAANSSKLAILPGGGDISAIAGQTKEIDFAKSRAMLRDAIREAFKVPKVALGDTDDVNFSNAELKQSLTIDEQRAMLSLPPLPMGRGNVFIVGNVVYDAAWKAV